MKKDKVSSMDPEKAKTLLSDNREVIMAFYTILLIIALFLAWVGGLFKFVHKKIWPLIVDKYNERTPLPDRKVDKIKEVCNMLFIDDHKFEIVSILTRNGWKNVKRIRDVESLEEKDIRDAHIIFIDIHGVGRRFSQEKEGLGLFAVLREKYADKRYVIYSANSEGDIFQEELSKADGLLKKNADYMEFEKYAEDFGKEIFTADGCAQKIGKILFEEKGYSVEKKKIISKMKKVYRSKKINEKFIAKVFKTSQGNLIYNILKSYFIE